MAYAFERERALAELAVRRACQLCQAVRRELVGGHSAMKQDRSPVTVADFGAQALVSLTLAAGTPEIPLVGEEDASALRDGEASGLLPLVLEHTRRILPEASEAQMLDAIDRGRDLGGLPGRRWVLDPIDGTKGFLRGDQYAVALALLVDGEVVLGLLGCPALPVRPNTDEPRGDEPRGDEPRGCLFVGVRGEGAVQESLQGGARRRVRVAKDADPRSATFCESVESEHSSHGRHAGIARRLGVTAAPVRMDSQCKYAAVGRGQASIYLRLPTGAGYTEKIWDHAAGAVLVEAAGGRVSDARGEPLDFSLGRTLANNSGVVATNGRLHDSVLEAIAATGEV